LQVARLNAKRFADAAHLMLTSGDVALAGALAILAIEEAQKRELIMGILLESEKRKRKELWQAFRSHPSKTRRLATALAARFTAEGLAGSFREGVAAVEPSIPKANELEALKQLWLYAECYRGGTWALPAANVDRGRVEALLGYVHVLIEGKHDESPEELAVYVRHFGTRHSTAHERIAAIRALVAELVEKGFSKRGAWDRLLRDLDAIEASRSGDPPANE
jgi:AbiV family abortive infection protein